MNRILQPKQHFLKNSLRFGTYGPLKYGHFPTNLDHAICTNFADMFTLDKISWVNAIDFKIKSKYFRVFRIEQLMTVMKMKNEKLLLLLL